MKVGMKIAWAILVVNVAGFVVFLLSQKASVFPAKGVRVQAVSLANIVPAGEITAGRVIEQEILLSDTEKEKLRSLEGDAGDVWVGIFMANYTDRYNKGKMKIELILDSTAVAEEIDMGEVKDNAMHEVYFKKIKWKGLGNGKVVLRVAGVNGVEGSSTTLWLTEDKIRGTAHMDGKAIDKGLIFSIYCLGAKTLFKWQPVLLILIAQVFINILVFTYVAGVKKRKQQAENNAS